MKQFLIYIITTVFTTGLSGHLNAQVTIDKTVADTNTVITGLDIPWEILYGPDGWLWVTERFGRISRVHPETGEQDIILDHSGFVVQQGESGMLGMALHPEFPEDRRVYVVYTYPANGIKEKLVHFSYDGYELIDETVLIEGIEGNSTHNGSRLIFTPDSKLLMTTGDAQDLSAPQNPDHMSGKILRINPDGTIPEDNPIPGSYVYTLGHRNAQGLYFSSDGTLFSSEHGPSTDDEINRIEAGRNYGWPEVSGFCNTPEEMSYCEQHDIMEPLIAWTPTIATSDIIFYEKDMIPEWTGSILLTVLKDKRLVELELSDDGQEIIAENHYFIDFWGRLRDICVGPEGEIYLATNGDSWSNNDPFSHSIIRLKVNEATGATDQTNDTGITILRDAFNQHLIVKSGPEFMGSYWQILNLQGAVLDSGYIQSPWLKINNAYKPGIYLMQIQSAKNEVFVKKIVSRTL